MGSGGACFSSVIVVVVVFSRHVPDQVKVDTAPARWKRHFPVRAARGRLIDTSQTRPLALIGCVDPERWILANQITATGWSHRQLTCIYCQNIMTILTNITKKTKRLQI